MTLEAKGSIWYGLHFYPGVAEYREEGKEPYRVFLNEDTLRSMDPTFQGCPVFVLHVDEIETDLNSLRSEADGWVVESFYNQADGKHWAKFVIVSEKGEEAIKRGLKLSNCYYPKSFAPGGLWNGVAYEKEIKEASYEHLAIVPDPRYQESVIMTPDQFKQYNDDNIAELKKLSNNNEGAPKMKLNFFKRAKVENSTDLESMSVLLPKSNVEVSLLKLINEMDEKEAHKNEEKMAEGHHMVECMGNKMSVNEMVNAFKAMKDELEDMKKPKEEPKENDDDGMENEEDDGEPQDNKKPNESDDKVAMKKEMAPEKEEGKEVKDAKKANALEKAEAIKNAGFNNSSLTQAPELFLPMHQLARGKSLFGSGK